MIPTEVFKSFQAWIDENAPRVAKMSEPITPDQLTKLLEMFPADVIKETLEAMHNHKPLTKKYVSAYLTARAWCKMRNDKTTPTDSLSEAAQKIKDAQSTNKKR